MIEWLALPEFALSANLLVDFSRGKVQPTFALATACGWRSKLNQKMHVIRHHDETIQIVTISIKIKERIHNDFGKVATPQKTLAVTRVEMRIPPAFADFAKLLAQR